MRLRELIPVLAALELSLALVSAQQRLPPSAERAALDELFSLRSIDDEVTRGGGRPL